MKILRNVEAPERGTTRSEVSVEVIKFAHSSDKNLKFECDSKKEALTTYSTAGSCIKSHGFNLRAIKSGNDVYVVRKERM